MEKRATNSAQKAQKVQSANWKEEMTLKKRLDTLESLRRQVVSSITLEQRATYNRFRVKLQRSELASARLLGHAHGARSESLRATAGGCQPHGNDGGAQVAINALLLLQRQQRRPVSAAAVSSTSRQPRVDSTPRPPSRVTGPPPPPPPPRPPPPPVSAQPRTARHRAQDVQPLPALVEQSDDGGGRCRAVRPGTAPQRTAARKRSSPWRRPRPVSSVNVAGTDMDTANCKVPPSSLGAGVTRVTFSTNKGPEGELGGHAPGSEQFLHMAREHKVITPAPSGIDTTLDTTSPPGKQTMSQTGDPQSKASIQECGGGGGNIGGAMRVFLQNVKPTGSSPAEEALARLRREQDEEKEQLRAFVEKLQPLQVPAELTRELETPWTHRATSTRVDECATLDPEEELSKWMVVGKEAKSRSLTIRALDRTGSPCEFSAEMLFVEFYNASLTRENWEERKWFNNDPYTLVN
ncbi:unnamed protein product [Lampetra planeri]